MGDIHCIGVPEGGVGDVRERSEEGKTAAPNDDEIRGARLIKRGVPMIVRPRRSKPCRVPPRAKTTMERMNVASKTGMAMSQAAKPKKGITEMAQVSNNRIHADLAGAM